MRALAGLVGAALLVAVSIGSIVMALSRPASRRIGGGLVIALVAGCLLVGVAGDRLGGAVVLLITGAGFWLFDRGVPGNRPRPGWLRAWAVLLVIVAVAALVIAVGDLRAGWPTGYA